MKDPTISQVIKIDLYTETILAPFRKEFIDRLKKGDHYDRAIGTILEAYAGQRLFIKYTLGDFGTYLALRESARRNQRVYGNYRFGKDRTGSVGENSGEIREELKDAE